MDELIPQLDRARHAIDPAWDTARATRARDAFRARLKRRQRARVAAIVAIPVALGLALWLVPRAPEEMPVAVAPSPSPPETPTGAWRFWDGSLATPVDADAQLDAVEVTPTRIAVDVARGAGHFEVTPGVTEREFIVRANGVTVRVIGTAFTVGLEGERARVTVEHGRVAVEFEGGQAVLEDGESRLFPPVEVVAEAPPEPAPAPAPPREPDRSWRRLAERGDFGEAFDALDGAEVRDRAEELLLAADAARLSGHARESLPYFQRVLRSHADDPRAPLAAFQMGRVLLGELGQPREAAEAFARARALAGGGSLAEDALAREVEARSAAGETEQARALAEAYVAQYPEGQRVHAVRRFGGI